MVSKGVWILIINIKALDKRSYSANIFLIPPRNHMWVEGFLVGTHELFSWRYKKTINTIFDMITTLCP